MFTLVVEICYKVIHQECMYLISQRRALPEDVVQQKLNLV